MGKLSLGMLVGGARAFLRGSVCVHLGGGLECCEISILSPQCLAYILACKTTWVL